MADEDFPPPDPDLRADFVAEYACRCFRINPSKVMTDDFKETLLKFFDRREYSIVTIVSNPGATVPAIEFNWPEKIKAKAVFFLKKDPKASIPKEDFKLHIKYGELSPNLLSQLSCSTDDVVFSNCFLLLISVDYFVFYVL